MIQRASYGHSIAFCSLSKEDKRRQSNGRGEDVLSSYSICYLLPRSPTCRILFATSNLSISIHPSSIPLSQLHCH